MIGTRITRFRGRRLRYTGCNGKLYDPLTGNRYAKLETFDRPGDIMREFAWGIRHADEPLREYHAFVCIWDTKREIEYTYFDILNSKGAVRFGRWLPTHRE
jgi:hypothetical protein